MAFPTNNEQLMLELVNRARLDPLSEAARFGIGLNDGIPVGQQITAAPKAPLAMNELLIDSSRFHSQWMIDNDNFNHGPGDGVGTSPADRMTAAGYAFTPPSSSGENISWTGSFPGSPNLTTAIVQQHQGLFESPGHRANILREGFREIGVGQILGPFTHTDGITYNASMVTQNFASTGTRSQFITGVVYNDSDVNGFYSVGEGLGGVTVNVGALPAVNTFGSGGYNIVNAPSGTTTVSFQGGGLAGAVSVQVAMASQNVKVDLINGNTIHSSASATLGAGATNLRLLGDAANGAGNAGNNTIIGNGASNTLDGAGGFDTGAFGAAHSGFRIITEKVDGVFQTRVIDQAGGLGTDTLIGMEQMNFGGQNFGLAGAQQNLISNIDGGRFDDVLFRSSTTGQLIYRDMAADGAPVGWGAATGNLTGAWIAAGSGDSDGNGFADVFAQNSANGQVLLALQGPAGLLGWNNATTPLSSEWVARGAGDINGDGNWDAVVQNTTNGTIFVAFQNGGFSSWGVVSASLTSAWQAVGVGDVNRDGFADVVVQNISEPGAPILYANMAGGTFSGWGVVTTSLDANWRGVEVADVNGDAFADVLVRNQTDGSVLYADLATGTVQWGIVTQSVTSDWHARTTADVDADGWRDVIFQEGASGVALWANMDAGNFAGWGVVSNSSGTDWLVV